MGYSWIAKQTVKKDEAREHRISMEAIVDAIEGLDVDNDTEEAIADWHCWVARGYELG